MPQNSYELPSIYTQRSYTAEGMTSQEELTVQKSTDSYNHFQAIPGIDEEEAEEENMRNLQTVKQQGQQAWILSWLLLGASLSILLFTAIPVVTNMPDVIPSFFSGNSLFRLFDPLVTLPLNLYVMTKASVIITGGKSNYVFIFSEQTIAWLLWSWGAGIYVQGHGIHLAAAMFKHPVQDFNLAHPEIVSQYPILQEIYSYMRDDWEHIIAHYMYAGGAMIMSWSQIFAFRNEIHGPIHLRTKIVFIIGLIIYGLLIAGVAIEFPYGLYFGVVYTIIIGVICFIGIILNRNGLKRGGLFTIGKRLVLQFYLGACIVGLIVIIVWIGIHGFKNRLDAGVAT